MRQALKSFFYSRGKFQPVYFWATTIMSGIVVALVEKLNGVTYISDTLLLGLLGFVNVLLGMYSIYRFKKDKEVK